MGQCVTKCKNPTSSLGSKSGEKDSGKSHAKKGGGGGGAGSGHKEDSKFPADVNGTKSPEVTVETSVAPVLLGEVRREEPEPEGEGLSIARIEEMFLLYKDEHEDAILEEGMEKFCNDLHVDPAEFKVLVLAWKFQAATMCKFTRKEFVEGCKAIQADSLRGICLRFSALMEESRGEESFKDLYRFTFQFGLDADEGQRSLQRAIAIALWRLVFTLDTPPVLERWLDFLSENPCGVRGISRDTWNMFLNFTQSIGPDLSNYSEDEAWPSLFDSFVEWETERRRRERAEQEERRRREEEQEEAGLEHQEAETEPTTDCMEASAWGGL
ncbi:DCN1-like protein 3 [Electrophorus electricus]|uniref:DCN1-like protein n=1 Tax=Electrophorus electricus TaxID=8005 RepID=A0A4W4HP27_ELEEL|nr:DCN1-like protein 3 [Electrophorus electricus]XP_026858893.2 DCN1-like protein 3 [Electrophorus electricus]XP_026858894.2 DCN1-like protein 3 [Electrophorus electricus]XP_026858895.2 DCN1-like protein 3 [Electrophorus electricus]